MKRIYKIVISIVLVALTLCALASCVDKPQAKTLSDVVPELNEHEMAVIIKNGESDYEVYVVDISVDLASYSSTSCVAVLTYLKENKGLVLDWTESEYGMYINAIGGITPDASKHEYVEIFTSNPNYQGTWAGVTTYEAGNVTLKSASVGVSDLQYGYGDVIYFEIATY